MKSPTTTEPAEAIGQRYRRGHGRGRGHRRGLTLVELAIALVVMTTLLTMAVPSFTGWLAQHRLRAAAHHLAADLSEARHEAVRQARPVHLIFKPGAIWCYAIATSDPADCDPPARDSALPPDPSLLKVVRSSAHPGVQLLQAPAQSFDGRGGIASQGDVLLASARGELLKVRLWRSGRPAVCAVEAAVANLPRC